MLTRKQWRDQVIEQALEPDLPIVDAHHHIWDAAPVEPYEAYNVETLIADKSTSGHNVVATVYVDSHSNYRLTGPEALRPVGETEHVERLANDAIRRGGKAAGICTAIVPHANLCLGSAVGEVLDAHLAASPRMRGIRHMTAFDFELPPVFGCLTPGVMLSPEFSAGLSQLAPRGLTFDAWMFHPQLPELLALARRHPETSIVLCHTGGPMGIGRYASRRAEGFLEWKNGMTAIAKCPNVVSKIGALNMPFTGLDATNRDKPYSSEEMAAIQRDVVLTTIDLFGPSRCMFETNFPVDMPATSYTNIWNCFKRISSGFSPAERADLFFGVANRTYRMALTRPPK